MTGEVAPAELRRWKVWLLATRPATLTVALAPVLVGAAVAWRHAETAGVRWAAVLAAALGAVFIQVGTNLANDVFDYEKGADTEERLGPLRVTQAGLLAPREVRAGMVLSFALATLCGLYLLTVGGWVIAAIGVASIASGIAYTGGPFPLGYNGLGDAFVFAFFGLVAVCGTVWVALGQLPATAWMAAVPVGALATSVLVVNNVRDHETDARAGKRTLVVRLGRRFGVAEYALCHLVALASCAILAAKLGSPWALLPALTAPMGMALARKVATTQGRALNPLLGASARLLLGYAGLLAAGLVLAGR